MHVPVVGSVAGTAFRGMPFHVEVARAQPRNTQSCPDTLVAFAESEVGTAFRDAPSDAEVEAARLALELAHERAQREKAERDFEVRLLIDQILRTC